MKDGYKLLIVINGKGGVGKDSLINYLTNFYKIKNKSSIDPIKEIAQNYANYNGGREDKDRKFLSDLKALFTDYCDLPNKYLLNEYHSFIKNNEENIMFVHIREPKEIERFIKLIGNNKVKTLLIKGRKDDVNYGNASDDNVENYNYDYVFINKSPLADAEKEFLVFFENIVKNQK